MKLGKFEFNKGEEKRNRYETLRIRRRELIKAPAVFKERYSWGMEYEVKKERTC